LKDSLDELYVAMSLGQRTSILAKLQQIVPQFSYPDGDEVRGTEKMTLKPDAFAIMSEAQPEAPALADAPRSPYRTWRVTPQTNPSLGPTFGPIGSGTGD
jgi:hypothetical protein